MQHAASRTATWCTQDTNIQHLHDETLTLSIHEHLQLHVSQYSSHVLHKHTTYFNTPSLMLHNKHSHISPHCHYNSHKANMCHIHTSIVSRYLATRGNSKIMRTPPPHISTSEEILPRLTRRTLAQLEQINHPFSNHTYTKSTPNHINHYYAPFITLTYTTHIISSTALTYAPHCHPLICGRPVLLVRWTEKLGGGPPARRSDSPHLQGSGEWVDNNKSTKE